MLLFVWHETWWDLSVLLSLRVCHLTDSDRTLPDASPWISVHTTARINASMAWMWNYSWFYSACVDIAWLCMLHVLPGCMLHMLPGCMLHMLHGCMLHMHWITILHLHYQVVFLAGTVIKLLDKYKAHKLLCSCGILLKICPWLFPFESFIRAVLCFNYNKLSKPYYNVVLSFNKRYLDAG